VNTFFFFTFSLQLTKHYESIQNQLECDFHKRTSGFFYAVKKAASFRIKKDSAGTFQNDRNKNSSAYSRTIVWL